VFTIYFKIVKQKNSQAIPAPSLSLTRSTYNNIIYSHVQRTWSSPNTSSHDELNRI